MPPDGPNMDSAGTGSTDTTSAASGGGEGLVSTGATVESRYHNRMQDIVGVNVEDLREFRSSSMEEFWQFFIAEFFVAGAFWLGAERFMTVPEWEKDILFWICLFAILAGAVIGFFGYKQLSRRRARIERIILAGTKQLSDAVST